MKSKSRPKLGEWREDFRDYASQWGYRPGSKVSKLINELREEYRMKYGCDYRLFKIGKGRFRVEPGEQSRVGVEYAKSLAPRFGVEITT